ncbi:MAG: EamA family transporter, partial [Pseudoxanthomonas sp.]
LGSAMASQLGMVGPVSTIVMSMLIFGDPRGPWQIAGTVLVMIGVFVVTRPVR